MATIPPKESDLTSELLDLISFDESFISETYLSWLNSPAVTRFSRQRRQSHTEQSCQNYLSSIRSNNHFMWAVVLKENAKPIHVGNIVAYVDRNDATANLTIMIGETNLHAKGIGTQSFQLALNWLLTKGHLRKVYAGTMATNLGMLKVMENCQMEKEGIYKKHFLLDGQEIDMITAAKFQNTNDDL